MNEQKVNSGVRLASMFLDHIIMTVVIMCLCIPAMIPFIIHSINATNNGQPPDMDPFGNAIYFFMIGFAVYFCKDCINGRSPAKRILKLQVVNNKTGQPASPLRCMVRDLFIVIWPIEGVIALINPSRRIGDLVAGTKLVPYDPPAEKPKLKYGQIALAFCVAYGAMLLYLLPFKMLIKP